MHTPAHPDVPAPVGDGVYVLDRARRIQAWNEFAVTISGHAARDVLGRSCADGLLNHVDEDGQSLCGARCPLLATMRDGQTREARVFLHHRDGHLIPVRVQASPVYDSAGAITGAVESFRDDSDAAAVSRRITELEALALLDPLTVIGNRRYLESCLASELAGLDPEHVSFGVIVLDIDRFKLVNDTYGHGAGDGVLQTVATTLVHVAGADAGVARVGGDEFVVVARVTSERQLEQVGARMQRMVAHTQHRYGAHRLHVTASIGLSVAQIGDTADSLLARADVALLRAKRAGAHRRRIADDGANPENGPSTAR